MGLPVQTVRCDNSGENIKLQETCSNKEWKLNVNFEFTSRETPQQNSIVEVGFATLLKRGLSIMIASKVPKQKRYLFFRKAFEAATLLDGLTIITLDNVEATRYEHWGDKIPEWDKNIKDLGRDRSCKSRCQEAVQS